MVEQNLNANLNGYWMFPYKVGILCGSENKDGRFHMTHLLTQKSMTK